MSKLRIFPSGFVTRSTRFWLLPLICSATIGLCICPSLAADIPTFDPTRYEQVFGDPDEFIQKFEDGVRPKLNEYMGLGIACAGFGLVLKSVFS